MKNYLLITTLTVALTPQALVAMHSNDDNPASTTAFVDPSRRDWHGCVKLQSHISVLNDADPRNMQVQIGKTELTQSYLISAQQNGSLKKAIFDCLESINAHNSSSESPFTTIDITPLKEHPYFAPKPTQSLLEDKLAKLKATDPDKVFVPALSASKRESKAAIVERLLTLQNAITVDEKNDIVTIDGPLIEAFVYNNDPAPKTPTPEAVVEKVTINVPTLRERLIHPVNLASLALVGLVCWQASKYANTSDL